MQMVTQFHSAVYGVLPMPSITTLQLLKVREEPSHMAMPYLVNVSVCLLLSPPSMVRALLRLIPAVVASCNSVMVSPSAAAASAASKVAYSFPLILATLPSANAPPREENQQNDQRKTKQFFAVHHTNLHLQKCKIVIYYSTVCTVFRQVICSRFKKIVTLGNIKPCADGIPAARPRAAFHPAG